MCTRWARGYMDSKKIASVRALPLAAVLESLGGERDPKDPARNWRVGASRLTVTDSRFFDHNAAGALHRMRAGTAGGGGAIDLVQYLKDVDFREAVRVLGGMDAAQHTPVRTLHKARDPSVHAIAQPGSAPTPAPERAARARAYLIDVRALPEPLVDQAFRSGAAFADRLGNVVFPLRNETGEVIGHELRGTSGKPFHSVHGAKGMFITKAGPERTAAFVESGIEALSYQALRGSGLILSTTGSAVELPSRMAKALQGRGYAITAAFNADQSGDRAAERLSASLGGALRRDRPDPRLGKDWNELLQRQRAERQEASRTDPGAEHIMEAGAMAR